MPKKPAVVQDQQAVETQLRTWRRNPMVTDEQLARDILAAIALARGSRGESAPGVA